VLSVPAVQNLLVTVALPVVRPALIVTLEQHWAVGQPSSPVMRSSRRRAVTLGDRHLLKE
jgi:hypothetical protein